MSAPLDRDHRIQLMQEAEARMKDRARAWMANPAIKGMFAEPAPGQEKTVAITRRTVRLKRCG